MTAIRKHAVIARGQAADRAGQDSARDPLGTQTSEHLGYIKHDPARRDLAGSRNGARTKTVLTLVGGCWLRSSAARRDPYR